MSRGRVFAVSVLVILAWAWSASGSWLFTATAGLMLAVSSVGLMVVVGWSSEVSLAQAGLTGTALYICAWGDRIGWSGSGWSYPVAAAVAIAAVALISAVIAVGTARLSGVYILVVTLALQTMIELTVFTQPSMAGHEFRLVSSRPSLFGVSLEGDLRFFLFSLAVLGLVMLFLVRLRRTRFGRALLLVGTDRQVAGAVGVSPWRARVFAFVLAGTCAGIAGALTALLYPTPPSPGGYTAFFSLFYVAVPVLAGFQSVAMVAVVAVAFVMLPEALESLRVSPFLLGGLGLLAGTLAGRGGLSGLVLNRVRGRRPEPAPERDRIHQRAMTVLEDYLPSRLESGAVLTVHDVSVTFGGIQALDGASLSLPAGQLVGLVGPNGAGKTTLFDVISGFREPAQGRILLAGEDITRLRPWDRAALGLSRTFQASRVDLDQTVAENLLAGAYTMTDGNVVESVLGLPKARTSMRRSERAAWAVAELLDIEHYWSEPAGTLSFGNRRRVEIGRSIMSGPRVLLLDEPSAGLDPTASRLLFSLIKRVQSDLGITLLLVEHDVREVLENCDLVYALSQGTVVASGSADDIVRHPAVQAQYLGTSYKFRSGVGPFAG